MQTSGTIKKKYIVPSGISFGGNYSKHIKRIKQKPSYTFGDLSTISTILSEFLDDLRQRHFGLSPKNKDPREKGEREQRLQGNQRVEVPAVEGIGGN